MQIWHSAIFNVNVERSNLKLDVRHGVQASVVPYIFAKKPELLNVGPMSALRRAVENCEVESTTTLMKYNADFMSNAKIHLYSLPDVFHDF